MSLNKIILILIILTNSLLASESFWKKLTNIENTYFNKISILNLIDNDKNKTISIIQDNNSSLKRFDNQFKSFFNLINLIDFLQN